MRSEYNNQSNIKTNPLIILNIGIDINIFVSKVSPNIENIAFKYLSKFDNFAHIRKATQLDFEIRIPGRTSRTDSVSR